MHHLVLVDVPEEKTCAMPDCDKFTVRSMQPDHRIHLVRQKKKKKVKKKKEEDVWITGGPSQLAEGLGTYRSIDARGGNQNAEPDVPHRLPNGRHQGSVTPPH